MLFLQMCKINSEVIIEYKELVYMEIFKNHNHCNASIETALKVTHQVKLVLLERKKTFRF